MVNFLVAKLQRNRIKRSNHQKKKIAVGQLLGSKTDVKEAEEDEEARDDNNDDNVSALELALNHSDTVGVLPTAAHVGEKSSISTMKLPKLRLPLILTRQRRSSCQNTPTIRSAVIPEEKDKRDDCVADEKSLVYVPELGTRVPQSSIPAVDQQSTLGDGIRINAPLEVTVTPESITGLLVKKNASHVKSSNVSKGGGNTKSLKVKGYIRVVGKATGVKIVSGTTKIVKSYRLGTSTSSLKTTSPSTNTTNTLIFSNAASGMKPTGSIRIRVPPPITDNNTTANYVALNFEIGVLTPDGIFPLGTATYQPLTRTSQLHHHEVLKVDPIHKGSIFQRRQTMAILPKSAATTVIGNNKDSFYRLQRNSKLSLNFDIKPLTDKEYTLQQKQQKVEPTKSIMSQSVDPLVTTLSYPLMDSKSGTAIDELRNIESAPNELPTDPNEGFVIYLSDHLSCCSDRDVESVNEQVVPTDDNKVLVTEALADGLNDEDAPSEAAIVVDVVEPRKIVQEMEQEAETHTIIDQNTRNYGWCNVFPICCCVGACGIRDDEVPKNASNKNEDALILPVKGDVPPLLDSLVSETMISIDPTNDGARSESSHRFGSEVNEILKSYSEMNVNTQDKSIVGTRHCCMACFGDEDVEDLKFVKVVSMKDQEVLLPLEPTKESDDAIYEAEIENECKPDPIEPIHVKQNILSGQEQRSRSLLAVLERGEGSNLVDRRVASRVDAVLDTMTESDGDDEEESVSLYSTSFSEDIDDVDGNVGCFQWMDAASSEDHDTYHSVSAMSSESHHVSVGRAIVNITETARIPISKSADITIVPTTRHMKNIVQSNSIS